MTLDVEMVQAALDRAAHKAVHGTREERSGRFILARDLETNPYSPDEERVAKFLADHGVGGGDDPIGALIATYGFVIGQRGTLKEALCLARADLVKAIVEIDRELKPYA